MRVLLAFLTLVASALVFLTDGSALDYRSRAMRFVPTPPNFAIAHPSIASRPTVIGNLVCTSSAATDCMVANMPLLSQVDARLKAPLIAYASQYCGKTPFEAQRQILLAH